MTKFELNRLNCIFAYYQKKKKKNCIFASFKFENIKKKKKTLRSLTVFTFSSQIQIQIKQRNPQTPTPTPLTLSLSQCLSNGHALEDSLGQVGLGFGLRHVPQAAAALSVSKRCPVRGLQPSPSGRSSIRRESSDPRDSGPGRTIGRQELTLRSAARVPLQCPRSRNGHPPPPHSPDGPRPYRPRSPMPLSGPPLSLSLFHFHFQFISVLFASKLGQFESQMIILGLNQFHKLSSILAFCCCIRLSW